MSDAAVKVDPEYYNTRLLETEANVGARSAGASFGGGGTGGGGGGGGLGRNVGGLPDLPDYLVRQHSLLGFYLSLNPGDEADAERHWGFPQPQRMAIAGATLVTPLLLALFLAGSWLWKACVIAVVTVGVRLALSFSLATFPDVELQVQGHTLGVWPHLTLGALAVTGMIWFVTAAASGTGWSTMWLAFTSLLFLAFAEAALRGGMWHYRWWTPAERFSFLKPWGDSPGTIGGGRGLGGGGGYGGYAPPRPSAAPPSAAPRQEYGSSFDGRSAGGGSGGGGGGGGGVQPGGMNIGGADPAGAAAASSIAAASASASAAAVAAAPKDESTGLLDANGSEGLEELEDIFASEKV
eukprot:g3994.t1